MARPSQPLEVKRRHGRTSTTDSGGRKLPDVATVTALPMADGIPEPPVEMGLDGRRLWAQAWGTAITWLSPASDLEQVTQACTLVDDIARARARYRATTDPADARAVVALSKELQAALSALGFTPTARARLGVAEVKAASALEGILDRRAKRQTRS